MPKSFTQSERLLIQKEMLEVGNQLIRTKNIKQITVEEITQSVNISKGSFYSFFATRELLFWTVIKEEEQMLMNEILEVAQKNTDQKERVRHIFYDVYLRKEWLIYKISDADLQYLARKLPPEMLEKEKANSVTYNCQLFQLFGVEPSCENIEFIQTSIQMIRLTETTSIHQSEAGKKRMQHLLVEAIVEELFGENK